jgi:hypothetical protein
MRKATVVLLMVLLIASFGLFAEDTSYCPPHPYEITRCMSVMATIPSTSFMWIGHCHRNSSSDAWTEEESVTDLDIEAFSTEEGRNCNTLCLHALSNNRLGYSIEMCARALKSEVDGCADAFINYTVMCGDAEVETDDDEVICDVTPAWEFEELFSMTHTQRSISLIIDSDDYDDAVSGRYYGRVCFTLTTN